MKETDKQEVKGIVGKELNSLTEQLAAIVNQLKAIEAKSDSLDKKFENVIVSGEGRSYVARSRLLHFHGSCFHFLLLCKHCWTYACRL